MAKISKKKHFVYIRKFILLISFVYVMAPNTPAVEGEAPENENTQRIATFAVLDLETTNLPAFSNNRVGITECCIYAFDAELLKENKNASQGDAYEIEHVKAQLPLEPRVVHKLNLLFYPSMIIHPVAEEKTGLSNYLLERESTLDDNAAQIIIGFLKHLPAPVCLVAHNGWYFDFPIIKRAFDTLNVQLPAGIRCVDSLRAFLEIDDKRQLEQIFISNLPEQEPEPELTSAHVEQLVTLDEPLSTDATNELTTSVDWRALNETTPKRPILTQAAAASKRKQLADDTDDDITPPAAKRKSKSLHARRQLFKNLNCAQDKRYPPRGRYGLGPMYERIFDQPPTNAHRAEADVEMLTKLVQHYGVDFQAFAEEQAVPFAAVIPIGGSPPKR